MMLESVVVDQLRSEVIEEDACVRHKCRQSATVPSRQVRWTADRRSRCRRIRDPQRWPAICRRNRCISFPFGERSHLSGYMRP